MTTIVIAPSEKTSIKSILTDIFDTVDVNTWTISDGKNVLTHKRYGGKVHLYNGGYLIVSAEDEDNEALTLGAFVNLLHRRAKDKIKAITIAF